jgi:hypothetical protein
MESTQPATAARGTMRMIDRPARLPNVPLARTGCPGRRRPRTPRGVRGRRLLLVSVLATAPGGGRAQRAGTRQREGADADQAGVLDVRGRAAPGGDTTGRGLAGAATRARTARARTARARTTGTALAPGAIRGRPAGRACASGTAAPGLRARLAPGSGLARRAGSGLPRGRLTSGVARLSLAGHRRRPLRLGRLRAARQDAESDGARQCRRREPTCPVAQDHAFSPIVVCTPAPSGRGAVLVTVPGRPAGDTRSAEDIATNGPLPSGERPS